MKPCPDGASREILFWLYRHIESRDRIRFSELSKVEDMFDTLIDWNLIDESLSLI